MESATAERICRDAKLIAGICDHDGMGKDEMCSSIRNAINRIIALCHPGEPVTETVLDYVLWMLGYIAVPHHWE
jgi:hypothetical protein